MHDPSFCLNHEIGRIKVQKKKNGQNQQINQPFHEQVESQSQTANKNFQTSNLILISPKYLLITKLKPLKYALELNFTIWCNAYTQNQIKTIPEAEVRISWVDDLNTGARIKTIPRLRLSTDSTSADAPTDNREKPRRGKASVTGCSRCYHFSFQSVLAESLAAKRLREGREESKQKREDSRVNDDIVLLFSNVC
jgi:hypothetical protein